MMDQLTESYQKDGFVNALPIINKTEALAHRQQLERVEAEMGSMHYQFKVHTIMKSAFDLATNPILLDTVEALLGPNILLYSTSFIIKEPQSETHVSWHQDLTYWGLSSDDQVSAWLALSPATIESGCMQMIPGSHKHGQYTHETKKDDNNVLLSGQRIQDVDASTAQSLALSPGEASLHHGWTVHSSMPNRSDDRRIGLNIQYIATHVKQLKAEEDSAILVRGEDQYGHFKKDLPAQTEFDRDAWETQQVLRENLIDIQGNANS